MRAPVASGTGLYAAGVVAAAAAGRPVWVLMPAVVIVALVVARGVWLAWPRLVGGAGNGR